MRTTFSALLLLMTAASQAQSNFSYTPEKPKPGDVIQITYEPAGDLAGVLQVPEVIASQLGAGQKVQEVVLTRSKGKLIGSFTTDTASNFVYLAFFVGDKKDNNGGKAYTIDLYDGDKVRKGAHSSHAMLYQYYGEAAGIDRDKQAAMEEYEREFQLYPDSKKISMLNYLSLYASEKKEDAPARIQKEIEAVMKDGLTSEDDYNRVSSMYSIAKLPQQSKMILELRKQKFPNGKWIAQENVQKMMMERDPAKKDALFAELKNKVATDSSFKFLEKVLPNYEASVVQAYATAKNWDAFKKRVEAVTDPAIRSQIYNGAAWNMQEAGVELDYAASISKMAVDQSKAEWKKPTGKKPDYYTQKQWDKNRGDVYGMYADTYAMIQYKLGNYKAGFPYAKEAAMDLGKGELAADNYTYALLAEKTMSAKKLKPQLEKFIKEGKANAETKEILKRVYVKEKGSEEGFDTYVADLQKENYGAMLAELRKSMLDQTAPSFALYNLNGEKIDIADLKGKTVVVDFWATWCGPCKASFPGMQKAVNKYKDNPNVKFIFVDTWERFETAAEKKTSAADFITKNKYSFDVLMDDDNKVVSSFGVDGIPTKFVIDPAGKIRFKAVGFDGSDDKLVQELSAMIEIASGAAGSKAF